MGNLKKEGGIKAVTTVGRKCLLQVQFVEKGML